MTWLLGQLHGLRGRESTAEKSDGKFSWATPANIVAALAMVVAAWCAWRMNDLQEHASVLHDPEQRIKRINFEKRIDLRRE